MRGLRTGEDGVPANEAVRGAYAGRSILQMVESDLDEAWAKHEEARGVDAEKVAQVRGRVRGLAQALATLRSPLSRSELGQGSRAWSEAILREERDSRARVARRGQMPAGT